MELATKFPNKLGGHGDAGGDADAAWCQYGLVFSGLMVKK